MKNGYSVIAWDDNVKARDQLLALNLDPKNLNISELSPTNIALCKVLILAPGIPLSHPTVLAAQEAGLEIICDIELYFRTHTAVQVIGITGTNGKSTTTALLTHTLQNLGATALMAGNIGTPIFDLSPQGGEIFVLELSSFQLELCPYFHPDISVLLNITPDHLDRHGTMEAYVAAKARIFEGPGKAIITGQDRHSQQTLHYVKLKGERQVIVVEESCAIEETAALRGPHNIQNMQAAYAVCRELGYEPDQILDAFESFPGLPHRQYPVRTIGPVSFINDSKATNAEATSKALNSFDHIYWIVGGQGKEGGLQGLEPYVPRIHHAFVIGESVDDFTGWLEKNSVPFTINGTLDKAVQEAYAAAIGENRAAVVLLSPAAASYDQYQNFEKRGENFTQLVEKLK